MARGKILLIALIGLLSSFHAFADDEDGKYKDLIVRVLKANARGECPKDLMSPLLQDQCEQQMPTMRKRFDALGAVKSAKYRGVQQTPMGPAEVYGVAFDNGHMTWLISTGPDGKIVIFWSPG
jgi:hypothetical protein